MAPAGYPRYHAASAAATATTPRRSAHHGLRADPLRGAGPHRHRHPQPPRQAQRLDRRDGPRGSRRRWTRRPRRGGAGDRAHRRRARLLRRRRHEDALRHRARGPAARVEEARPPAERDGAVRADFRGPYSYFPTVPKPIIAAINGATAGLGLVVALYCDLRIAADTAVFTTAFSRRGLIAEHGVSWMLPRLVGLPTPSTSCSRRARSSPRRRCTMGLVIAGAPAAALMDGVRAYARELAEPCPRARSAS